MNIFFLVFGGWLLGGFLTYIAAFGRMNDQDIVVFLDGAPLGGVAAMIAVAWPFFAGGELLHRATRNSEEACREMISKLTKLQNRLDGRNSKYFTRLVARDLAMFERRLAATIAKKAQ